MIEWIVTSSALILVVLVLRALLRGKISLRIQYALWLVVSVRLLVPVPLWKAPLPVTAANLAPEPGPRWESTRYQVEEVPLAEGGGVSNSRFQVQSDGTVTTSDSFSFPELDKEAGVIRVYADFWSPRQIALALWAAAAVLMALAMLWANLRFARRLKERRRPLEAEPCTVPVYTADGLPSPCLFGLFRPAIYLPPEAAEDGTVRAHVLAHELTHYAHKDHIWAVLRCLCLALHWYNPLVWLAVILSKRDGELACDEGAVARLGEEARFAYGRTLVGLAARRSSRPADLLSCSTAMTEGKKTIQQRVALLVKKPETRKAALFAALAVLALAVVFTFSAGSGSAYDQYGAQVEQAQAIRMTPPPYFSVFYPDPITDEDLLAQAKELLGKARELTAEEKKQDWSDAFFNAYSVTLFRAPADEEGARYRLCGKNGTDYVLIESGDWEDRENLKYTPVAALSDGFSEALLVLARQQYDRNIEAKIALTDEEIVWFNEVFFDQTEGFNIRVQFLSTLYDRPEDIDLYELFYNGSGLPEAKPISKEELRALTGSDNWQGVDCDRVTEAEMDAVLRTHTGLSLDQTNRVGLDQFTRLPDNDAYYHFHGDTNADVLKVISGFRSGDTLKLYYSYGYTDSDFRFLTLREVDGTYLFVSNQTASGQEGEYSDFLTRLSKAWSILPEHTSLGSGYSAITDRGYRDALYELLSQGTPSAAEDDTDLYMNWSRKFNTGEAAFFHIASPRKVTFYLSEQPVGCYLAVYEGADSRTCRRLAILPAGTVERAAELSLNWIRGGVL